MTAGDKKLWVTKAFSAAALQMSIQNFDDRIRPKMPAESVTGTRQTLAFFLPAVIQTYLATRATPKPAPPSPGDDPLMAGFDSPGLERYRNAKADREEMMRDRDRQILIVRDEIFPSLQQGATLIRQAADQATRLYGNGVADLINEAVDEAVTTWSKSLETSDVQLAAVSDGVGSDSEAPVDA